MQIILLSHGYFQSPPSGQNSNGKLEGLQALLYSWSRIHLGHPTFVFQCELRKLILVITFIPVLMCNNG